MAVPEYRIESNPSPEEWTDFAKLIFGEGWGFFNPETFYFFRLFENGHGARFAVSKATGELLGGVAYFLPPGLKETYIGYYVVAPQYRGKGIGMRCWNQVLEDEDPAKTGRRLVVHSALENMEKYRQKGRLPFSTEAVYVRFAVDCARIVSGVKFPEENEPNIVPFHSEILPKLVEFDAKIAGRRREVYYQRYLQMQSAVKGLCAEDGKTGEFLGFICSTLAAGNSSRIGPLYAKDISVALILLKKMAETFDQEFSFQVMTLSTMQNGFPEYLTEKLGATVAFKTYRSSSEPIDESHIDFSKIFSYTGNVMQTDC